MPERKGRGHASSAEGETDPRPSRRGEHPTRSPRGRHPADGARGGESGLGRGASRPWDPRLPAEGASAVGATRSPAPRAVPTCRCSAMRFHASRNATCAGGSPERRVRWTAGVSAPCVTPAPGGAHDARPWAQQPARDTQGLHGDPRHRATMPRHGEGRRGLGQRWQGRVEPATRPRGGRRVQTRVPSPGKGGRP